MRDQLAPIDYFLDKIAALEGTVAGEPERLARVNPDRYPHVKLRTLVRRVDLLSLGYSAGRPLEDLAGDFRNIVGDAQEIELFSVAVNAAGYRPHFFEFEMLSSWAVLFDDAVARDLLVDQASRELLDDCVISSVLIGETSSDFVYLPDARAELKLAVDQARDGDAEAASNTVESYVKSQWYNRFRSAAWWGSHKKLKSYYGYWCWPAAAVAKAYGIDDSALEGHKYYPWDLAHP